MDGWYVYIIECADGSYYTGITNDLERRTNEHASGKGARYTRARGVKGMVWRSYCADKGTALRREASIKALSRAKKKLLVEDGGEYNG